MSPDRVEAAQASETQAESARHRPRGAAAAKLATLAVVIGAAYWLGYWRNTSRPTEPPGTAPAARVAEESFVGFDPAEIDLGEQLWGEVVPLELPFVNLGEAPIVIQSLETSCDCTVVAEEEYEGGRVEIGEKFLLPAVLHTELNPGHKVRTLTIVDANQCKYTARINVDVVGTWSFAPDNIDFGEVLLGVPEEGPAEMVTWRSETDRFLGLDGANTPWLDCRTAERSADRVDVLLRVLRDRLPCGVSSASLVLRTDNVVKPAAVVFVKVKGAYALVARPDPVYLVGSEAQVIGFADEEGRPVRLLSVEATHDAIRVERLETGGELRVCNPEAVELRDPVSVCVTDDRGISKTVSVFCFQGAKR